MLFSTLAQSNVKRCSFSHKSWFYEKKEFYEKGLSDLHKPHKTPISNRTTFQKICKSGKKSLLVGINTMQPEQASIISVTHGTEKSVSDRLENPQDHTKNKSLVFRYIASQFGSHAEILLMRLRPIEVVILYTKLVTSSPQGGFTKAFRPQPGA